MATSVLGSPSFSASDLMVSRVDLAPVFWLIATLCERGNVAAMSVEMCEGVHVGQPMARDVIVEQPMISSVDSPWQVATKMDALPARPTIDRERLTPSACMLDNQSGIF
jgi:hypothetical protein